MDGLRVQLSKVADLQAAFTAPAASAPGEETELNTVLRSIRQRSTVVRMSFGNLPPVNPYDHAQPRKKNWATRARTGCLTCRSRRVKCDEAQPRCKRCALGSRNCVYDKTLSREAPVRGLPSPDWHVGEALDYYARIMTPMHDFHAPGDSAYEFNLDFSGLVYDENFDGDRFAMVMVSHRLQCLSSLRGIIPRYGAVPELNSLWARLFSQIAIVLEKLNRCIARPNGLIPALAHISKLMHVELNFGVPEWRAHAEGFGSLLKRYSYPLSDLQFPHNLTVQYMLVVASMCNTTSPPHDQIEHMSNWSDENIAIAYSHTGCHTFPAPTPVFQAMVRITHLRTLVAAGTRTAEWEPTARAAHAKIRSVDPDRWGEPYPTDHEFYPLAARMYQAAVALYAILTLPAPLAAIFVFPRGEEGAVANIVDAATTKTAAELSGVQPAVGDAAAAAADVQHRHDELDVAHAALERDDSRAARVRYRSRLFGLFRKATRTLPHSAGHMWPAAVLGVAFQEQKEEQAVLLNYIGPLRGWPASENGAASLYDKLVLFWASGKTRWDQCFYEPTSVLT